MKLKSKHSSCGVRCKEILVLATHAVVVLVYLLPLISRWIPVWNPDTFIREFASLKYDSSEHGFFMIVNSRHTLGNRSAIFKIVDFADYTFRGVANVAFASNSLGAFGIISVFMMSQRVII